jgi:hypothetical protein
MLENVNKALSKRQKAKRTRLQNRGAINRNQAREIMAEKSVIKEEECNEEEENGSLKQRRTGGRYYNICRKASCYKPEEWGSLRTNG